MASLSLFWQTFRRKSQWDDRPFVMRVRHGMIAAIAGDYQVMLNMSIELSGTITLERGAIVQLNWITGTGPVKEAA